jgi:hypothetical protein
MPNLKFYFTAKGQARSPMTDFFDTLTASVKAERILFRLRAIPHTAKVQLRAMQHSAESSFVFLTNFEGVLC